MSEHKELVIQLKKGSNKAFNLLYEEYFDLLYGFVFSLTKTHEKQFREPTFEECL